MGLQVNFHYSKNNKLLPYWNFLSKILTARLPLTKYSPTLPYISKIETLCTKFLLLIPGNGPDGDTHYFIAWINRPSRSFGPCKLLPSSRLHGHLRPRTLYFREYTMNRTDVSCLPSNTIIRPIIRSINPA